MYRTLNGTLADLKALRQPRTGHDEKAADVAAGSDLDECDLLLEPVLLDERDDLLGSIEAPGGGNVTAIVDLTARHGPKETSGAALGLYVVTAHSGADMWTGYDDYETACRAIDEGIGTKRAKLKAKFAAKRYFR